MVVASALTCAAGYFLWLAVRRAAGSAFIAGVVVAIFLFNPYVVSASLNGLETGVHLLCVAASLWWLARLYPQDELTARDGIVLGVLSALTFLSRTDSVILIGVLLLFLLAARPDAKRLAQLAAAGALAGLIVTPWLLWNYANFGSIIQSSGIPLTTFAKRVWEVRSGGQNPLPTLLTLTGYYLGIGLRFSGFNVLAFLIVAFPVMIAALRHRRARGSWRGFASGGEARWLAIMALYCIGYIAFNALIRWFMRDWYFASALLVFYVGLGVFLAIYLRVAKGFLRRELPLTAVTGAALVVILTLGWIGETENSVFRYWGRPEKYPPQVGMFEAATWLPGNTPADARIGSFNAGIVSYYGGRTIINLDGLMNDQVQPYIEQNRILCYWVEADLDYIVDFREVFDNWQPLFTPDLSVSSEALAATYSPVFERPDVPPTGYVIVRFDKPRLRALVASICD